MTTIVSQPVNQPINQPIHYPSGDGQPIAETCDHVYVILATIAVLRQYFSDQQACVLGNQFLYYSQGFPRLRCAPDVMVILGTEPGSRDSYKLWEEGEVPKVVFEMTSESTRQTDEGFKRDLYAQIGIEEYWQFDPKGEWITEQLRGFQLQDDRYIPITNATSSALGLRLEVSDTLISFYRLDNGEKLLIPDELYEQAQQLQQELSQTQAELLATRSQAEALQAQLDQYRDRFGSL